MSGPSFYGEPDGPIPDHPAFVDDAPLTEHEGTLLLDCRFDGRRWGLIGGPADNHESLAATLCREVAGGMRPSKALPRLCQGQTR